jgi:LysM repeat protein
MAIIKGGTAKVQKGDTLSSIAKAAGTTVSAIAKANNISNVNLIKPGQVFTIPKAGGTGSVVSGTPISTASGFNEGPDAARFYRQEGVTPPPIVEEEPPASGGLTQEEVDALIAAALAGQNATNSAQMAMLQSQIAALLASQKSTQDFAREQATIAAAERAKQQEQQRVSTIAVLTERFQRYGLGSLVDKIKSLAIDGATESTITLALQESEEYKTRFKANQERIKKGLAVLTPAEYLNVEDGYRQVLRSYGLNQFDNDDYVQQFIANDVSPTELSNRVVTAVQRVQNADPAITQQLREYYGLGQPDLVAYVLDPNQQFQKIERQVAAAEIGVAAARQGLQAGVSVAEQLAAQGISQAEAQKGYATIADILPTAEKLSDIYGTTLDGYGQSEAEQEVFNSLASAQRKRQRLTARELAAFSGSSGVSRTSLTTSNVGQF